MKHEIELENRLVLGQDHNAAIVRREMVVDLRSHQKKCLEVRCAQEMIVVKRNRVLCDRPNVWDVEWDRRPRDDRLEIPPRRSPY